MYKRADGDKDRRNSWPAGEPPLAGRFNSNAGSQVDRSRLMRPSPAADGLASGHLYVRDGQATSVLPGGVRVDSTRCGRHPSLATLQPIEKIAHETVVANSKGISI